jgi:hydroxylamine reductase
MDMFCFQCQETAKNEGCTRRGVCGKVPEVATLQDSLIWLLKGVSFYAIEARKQGIDTAEADPFVLEGLFATITNVNFDQDRFVVWARQAIEVRDGLKSQLPTAPSGPIPEFASWVPQAWDVESLVEKGSTVGIQAELDAVGTDVHSLRWTLIYGLKGLAAYTDHAYVLDYRDDNILHFIEDALLAAADDSASVDEMVGWVLKCGEMGVQAMALLDKANTETYGHPEPTRVNIGVKPGPAILISGHDLRDLDELLQQTADKGVNVYTHGEMLPANAYPHFKKYPHLAGNYGGSWWHQKQEFDSFNGAILLTTNCLVPPRGSYIDRLFTTGLVGWPDVPHIANRPLGGQKDFGPVIERALQLGSPRAIDEGSIPIGFAHNAVLSVADQVVEAVKSGAIKRFVVMAGCDGRHATRQYFTDVAKALPDDTVILTAGCAKYRYNKLGLGDIAGIPRVLDAGQCNDSYSLAVVAMKLAEAFELESVNELPLSFDIAWYEQKAVLVLLSLLSLGVKNIRLGPTLPAFVSPNVLQVLVDNFGIKPTTTVEEDVPAILAGK